MKKERERSGRACEVLYLGVRAAAVLKTHSIPYDTAQLHPKLFCHTLGHSHSSLSVLSERERESVISESGRASFLFKNKRASNRNAHYMTQICTMQRPV
jgi:hypothetical protein